MDSKIREVVDLIDGLASDTSVPKNIRKALSDAKQRLESADEPNVRISAAIYLIESISDDINMPVHARTQVWTIMGALESIKTA